MLVDVRCISSSNALRGPRALESHLEKGMARKALKEKGPRAQKAKAPRPTPRLWYATAYTLERLEPESMACDDACTLERPLNLVWLCILSCADAPQRRLNNAEVTLDTGATESACGLETMERFLNATGCRYHVNLEDRPVFRFGNGRTMQATSRADVVTAALGLLPVYFLDDYHSQTTPLLLGGRVLRELQAVINYGDRTLIFQKRGGDLRLLPLGSTPGGHLIDRQPGGFQSQPRTCEDVCFRKVRDPDAPGA